MTTITSRALPYFNLLHSAALVIFNTPKSDAARFWRSISIMCSPKKFHVISALACMVFSAGCHAHFPYPIEDTGINIDTSTARFFWVDNDHIIFGGFSHERKIGLDGQDPYASIPMSIYIWDVKSKTYVRYSDWGESRKNSILCFNRGYIVYSLNIEDDPERSNLNDIRAGAFRSEVKVPPENKSAATEAVKKCAAYPRLRENDVSNSKSINQIYNLRSEDGYIFVGENSTGIGPPVYKGNEDDLVKLYRPGQATPIDLPILAKEMYAARFTYSEYANEYVLIPGTWRTHDISKDGVTTWPAGMSMPIYLISPDGNVETIKIPPSAYPVTSVLPTRIGVYLTSSDYGQFGHVDGTWIWDGKKLIKLLDRQMGGDVSPDGCKLATADASSGQKYPTAKVIDFCKNTFQGK